MAKTTETDNATPDDIDSKATAGDQLPGKLSHPTPSDINESEVEMAYHRAVQDHCQLQSARKYPTWADFLSAAQVMGYRLPTGVPAA